jgi:hypothetical protein
MLRIIDGFDYITPNSAMGVWEAYGWSGNAEALNVTDPSATAFGYGRAMNFAENLNDYTAYRNLRGRYTSGLTFTIWGCRMLVPASGPIMDITMLDTMGGGGQFHISFTSTGNIHFTSYGGSVFSTPAWAFHPGKWFYLEVKWKSGTGTSGMVEVRVNTVPVLSFPAIDTAGGTPYGGIAHGVDVMQIHQGGAFGGGHLIDDFYLLDSTGTVNNDYLGNVRAQWLAPNANSTPLQWAIGGSAPAATNWQSALNAALDDTKYVYDTTPGDIDQYTVTPILNTPFVHGVEIGGVFRQDDATQRVVRNAYKTHATQYDGGVDYYINQFYTYYPDVIELNPFTGTSFTGSEANALTIGPKVIT